MVDVVVVGSIGLDDLKTPFGERKGVLGGSASYASVAASFFCKPGVVGIVGSDFPKKEIEFFKEKGIDTRGLVFSEGKTFRWSGVYEFDLNEAKTLKTELNVLSEFNPVVPEEYRESDFLFLGNLSPVIQLSVLKQMKKRPKLVVADTMNYWIETQREKVLQVVKETDVCLMNDGEARELFKTPNLLKAASEILGLDSELAIIKKGEHGCLLVTKESYFALPGYPLENVLDPTGSGDSFGGAFIGYLSKAREVSEKEVRKALVYASCVASFNAEGFSLEKLRKITREDIEERFKEFKKIIEF